MFQIGDRVRAIGNQGSYEIEGLEGTILNLFHGNRMSSVVFDGDFRGGHSLNGRLTGEQSRRGLWTSVDLLVLAEPRERIKKGFAKAVLKWGTNNA